MGLKTLEHQDKPVFYAGIKGDKLDPQTKCIHVLDAATSIPSQAFLNFAQLEEIILPPSLKRIGPQAFQGCKKLRSIILPDRVAIIGAQAFRDSGLLEITLPDSVTVIGEKAFAYCKDLRKIRFPAPPNAAEYTPQSSSSSRRLEIGVSVCKNCVALQDIDLPLGVTHLPDGAFKGCKSLERLRLPDSLQSVGQGAFQGCRQLKNIEWPHDMSEIVEAFL